MTILCTVCKQWIVLSFASSLGDFYKSRNYDNANTAISSLMQRYYNEESGIDDMISVYIYTEETERLKSRYVRT